MQQAVGWEWANSPEMSLWNSFTQTQLSRIRDPGPSPLGCTPPSWSEGQRDALWPDFPNSHFTALHSEAWQSNANCLCVMMFLLNRLAWWGNQTGRSRCWLPGPQLPLPVLPLPVLLDQHANSLLTILPFPPAVGPLSHAHSCLFSHNLSLRAYPVGSLSLRLRGEETKPFPRSCLSKSRQGAFEWARLYPLELLMYALMSNSHLWVEFMSLYSPQKPGQSLQHSKCSPNKCFLDRI